MILLVQFRTNQAGWHELKCVYEASELKYDQIKTLNLASNTITEDDIKQSLKRVRSVILGGTGEASYGDTDNAKKKWLRDVRKRAFKVIDESLKNSPGILGMCFGHQLLSEYYGGKVEVDEKQSETGVAAINLTTEGMNDPLFKNVPVNFSAIEGHKDSVVVKPKGAKILASSERCDFQALKFEDNIYGVQFHPEMNYQDLKFRLSLFPSYASNKNTNFKSKKIKYPKMILRNFVSGN